jgi:hypothetical protein
MSVVVSVVAPEINAEMYEAVTAKVMPGDQLPDQCHLHIAGPVEQGWRVITVWSSREDFDRFRNEKLLPAIQELAGDAAPPRWSLRSTQSTSWSRPDQSGGALRTSSRPASRPQAASADAFHTPLDAVSRA